MGRKPDLVVWSEENGYDAKLRSYPTNLGASSFELPQVDLSKSEAAKKMADSFNREREEIIQKIEKMYTEYADSVLVWESKMSFEPITGKSYYLYDLRGQNTLSLLSPNEWGKGKEFLGEFVLNSDRKWIRK
jgi:hypothetical protein